MPIDNHLERENNAIYDQANDIDDDYLMRSASPSDDDRSVQPNSDLDDNFAMEEPDQPVDILHAFTLGCVDANSNHIK